MKKLSRQQYVNIDGELTVYMSKRGLKLQQVIDEITEKSSMLSRRVRDYAMKIYIDKMMKDQVKKLQNKKNDK